MTLSPSLACVAPSGLSDRELQALFEQLVRDLLESPTYRDVIELLEVTPAERDPIAIQRAAQAIARHAIRTTLKHFRSRSVIMPTISRTHPPLPLPPRPKASRLPSSRLPSSSCPRSSRPKSSRPSLPSGRCADRPTSDLDRQQAYLKTLGSRLRSRRQSCRFSLAQLHHLTKIPLQHLQAFESGQLDALPTNPSYLWGTVRIWGNVLGLDGLKLAMGIPDSPTTELPIASAPPTSAQPVPTPSAAQAKPDNRFGRYVTYGTLAAGTIVGLQWLADTREAPTLPSAEPSAPPTASERQRQLEVQRAILPSDVAPPEGIRRHLRRD